MLRVLTFLATTLCSAAVLAFAGSLLLERRLADWEAVGVLLGAGVVVAGWEVAQRRKERRRVRGMRDSVLW